MVGDGKDSIVNDRNLSQDASNWWGILWSFERTPEVDSAFQVEAIAFKPYWLPKPLEHLLIRISCGSKRWVRVWSASAHSELSQFSLVAQESLAHDSSVPVQTLIDLQPSEFGMQDEASFFWSVDTPRRLKRVTVPKPWGEEIWYTGVEKRGVCGLFLSGISDQNPAIVTTSDEPEQSVPLPFLELALGCACPESKSSLPLLKELLPFDQPFYGELYTEVHTEKAETYLVTGLSNQCLERGFGEVKLGLHPQFARNWQDPSTRDEAATRLKSYEQLRERVDHCLEQAGHLFQEQVLLKEQGPQALESAKKKHVVEGLLEEERRSYVAVSEIFLRHQIFPGDVVRVPTRTPHALQPGVRVVEFQTPSYERFILASNQKVLTQQGWDIEAALETVIPDLSSEAISRVPTQNGTSIRNVVSFPGLSVQELAFIPEHQEQRSVVFQITHHSQRPLVLFALSGGQIEVGSSQSGRLSVGEAYLVLASKLQVVLKGAIGTRVALMVGSDAELQCALVH